MESAGLTIPTLDLVIIVCYLLGIMGIGIWAGYKKGASSEEFFLAGKSLRWPIIGAALFTANISTIHLVGLAADGYRIGLVVGNFEWMAAFTLIILGLVFAPFYLRNRLRTLPEYLEKRYSPITRTFMAFISILGALLIHIGISLYAGAKVMEHFFGINMYVSIVVIALITATYTIIGGLKAVVVTDSIQAVLLLLGAAVLTVVSITHLPDVGIHSLAELKAAVKPEQMNMIHGLKDASGFLNEYSWLTVIFGYFVLGIWYWCTDQTIVQKVLGARSEKDGQKGAIFAGFLKIIPVFLMVFPGIVGYLLFKEQIVEPNDTLLVMMKNLLPTGLRGLMAAGLLAALMSTIEAALNSTATVTAEDIVKRLRPRTRDRTLVLVGRITAAVVILLAMLWSTQGGRFTSIFVAINKIPMMFAPAITTVFLMGVFWRRGTKEAALATLSGGAVVGGLYFLIDLPVFGDVQWVSDPVRGLGIPFMMAGLILFIFCVALYVIVSLLTPRPAEVQLTDLCWSKPSQAIMRGRITGPTDPRVMSGILVVIMIILYIIFH
ncbi:MAG: sodium/solute symporter [Candidatus Aminicenantes bacterium]|nr:sodium/solute symporter [Candidatus Aminicenantes bacterium]